MARTAKYLSRPPIYHPLTLNECGDILSVDDMSRLLKRTNDTVTKLCREGRLPAVQIGKSWYVKKEDFAELFNNKMRNATAMYEVKS